VLQLVTRHSSLVTALMLIGLDAIPLTEARAGVGHYTFELARALARAAPADEFELAYPSVFPPLDLDEKETLPPNLKAARVRVGALSRHWWSVGLPRYVRRRGFRLFQDRKSTRLNSSHSQTSYAVFCLKKKTPSTSPASSSAP